MLRAPLRPLFHAAALAARAEDTRAHRTGNMSSISPEPGNRRRPSTRGEDAGRAATFSRRIECDGARGPAQSAPARGGGLREPGTWASRRDERR
ncbi:MAG TPA: hypothetical protein VFJ16_31900 [Longimicrobium sp.]|nr:hypothetical protein [Longimicrobium sp.]